MAEITARTGTRSRGPSQVLWEGESRSAREGRRSRLAQLDWALELLEELNLRGEPTVPSAVRRRLEQLGVLILPQESPTAVLEKVLLVQEVYLLHPVEVFSEGRGAYHRSRSEG